MIDNLQLKFGRAPGQQPEQLSAGGVTVFVGPNNSGKSKVLQELNRFFISGQENATDVILNNVTFHQFADEDVADEIARIQLEPLRSESVNPDRIIVGRKGQRNQVHRAQLEALLTDPHSNLSRFCSWYFQFHTLILDGRNRINLVNQQVAGDLQQPPQTSFQALFRDNERREEVRRIIEDAFGTYFVLDPTNMGQLRIRLSERAPNTEGEERGITEEAVEFHAAAQPIDDASDGVKAFTGMITEIIAGDPLALLMDEPEAFLHPALSFKLGKEVATAIAGTNKRLFASTHSPNFVMGCIQSGAPVNVVRLTYRGGVATARVLPNDEILTLMRDPLLRSTGVLAGLFYEFVVVTEADTDRAFYQEINERLLRTKPEWGIPNCLFLNAQNKQTVRRIIRPLRQLGIPAAGIVDIDVLKEGGNVWQDFLACGFIPGLEQQSLGQLRAQIKQKFDETGQDMKRDGGIDLLETNDKEAAQNLFERLEQYGLFVVSKGELETWLPQLGAAGHGPPWLIDAFERMGENPDDDNYIEAGEDDVWEFISKIRAWAGNSGRRGIPT